MAKLTDFVPVPADAAINGGHSSCPTKALVERYGSPRGSLTDDCAPVLREFWKQRMVTASVGPFRVTGHRKAVALLRESLAAVKAEDPELYAALGSAGMLCCRRVRGTQSTLSNHGLGLAVDITVGGKLDVRGDNMVQVGLLRLYGILKRFGWYWGAEFGTEDAMHFEVSAEKVREWQAEGSF